MTVEEETSDMENYAVEYIFHGMALSGNLKGLAMLFTQVGTSQTAEVQIERIINSRDHRGFTVLHRACESGHANLIEYLLEHGGDLTLSITGSDPRGWTALHLAAFGNHLEAIALLISRGADVNALDGTDSCFSPLSVAISKGHPEAALRLIDFGANVMQTDKDGFSLLHEAAHNSLITVTERLIKGGADIMATASDGSLPYNWALKSGKPALIRLLRPR